MSGLNQSITIMLVDDEEIALSSMNALFSLETEYNVLVFSDPRDAIREAERRPIDLVISDYLMPQMTGIDLLRQLRRLQPDMVRILLTGFADKENTIRAINELDLFQYLEKPWDNQQLLLVVEGGLRQHSLRRQLAEKVAEFTEVLADHRRLQERNSALERELEMAARVQRSLLPESMPDAHGYRFSSFYDPCHEIGGDYYGLRNHDSASVLLLADVSGHGVQAALSSMLIKATFEDTERGAADAVSLMESMNAALHRFLPNGMYAAATLAWITPDPGSLAVVNAGNPYPFVLRAADHRVDELPLAGMPLGIFGRGGPATFDCQQVGMASGDVLLLASDGIGDVQGAENEELFQDGKFRNALAELAGQEGSVVIKELVDRVREFAGDRQIPDDISMVAVERTS